MRSILTCLAAASALLSTAAASPSNGVWGRGSSSRSVIKPKVFIISMFAPEGEAWYGIKEFNLLAKNITVPGLSPILPDAHCTANGDVCQLTTGESEINAATTIASLVRYPGFDLTSTYFMIAGIAGVNPEVATIAGVTFARYAVQVALQYEFDPREVGPKYGTGYIPLGSMLPNQYPETIYGTEVFEVNQNLQHIAANLARKAKLADSAQAIAYRKHYAPNPAYAAATRPPCVVECDVATSDVYYSGTLLSAAFGDYMHLITNGSATYCTSAQEDNATLEALLRAAKNGLVDFARIIVMRTASDFDRPYPGQSATNNLFTEIEGGFEPSVTNIYLAGIHVVEGILSGWASTFAKGIKPDNYIGDIFGTLGGTPNFGPGSAYNDNPIKRRAAQKSKRAVPVKFMPAA